MNWDILCGALSGFGIAETRQGSFDRAEALLLLDDSAEDRPGALYVTESGTGPLRFRQALIVVIGPQPIQAEQFIRLEHGSLTGVFNALLRVKQYLDTLDSSLACCNSEQEIIDSASLLLKLPMFYLDDSYRVLALTRNLPSGFNGDREWIHMRENGFLSPESASRMRKSGDLDLLAASPDPVVYDSNGIFPWTSVVCNVWHQGVFSCRLNVLCIDGDTTPLRVRACAIVTAHLERMLSRRGRLSGDRPFENILLDLLHGIQLSEDFIRDRLKAAPYLTEELLMVFLLDVNTHHDHQIAPYYASLLKRLYPEESFIPLIFEEQLVLLAYATNEVGFDSLTVKLAHFFSTYHLRCGVSNPFRKLSDLRGYFDQAAFALNAEDGEDICFYRNVMLEHVLSFLPEEQARFLISPDLARLTKANEHYSFSLVETLKAYLECNCNLIRTSEKLFLHKNTLLYRLNHIKSILRCDLNDPDERLLLMLSFKLLERQTL